LAALGSTMSDRKWYERTLAFMSANPYYTASAVRLHLDRRNRNVAVLTQELERCS
jgi:hypothetical protein